VTADNDQIRHSIQFSRITLKFRDRDIERQFVSDELAGSMRIIRFALLSGACLYALFGILDSFMVPPDELSTIWTIRYGIACPTILIVLGLTFTRYFGRFAQALLVVASYISGFAIVAMTAVLPPPANYLYYAGLILVVIYCSSIIRIDFMWSCLFSGLLLVLYQVPAIAITHVPSRILINNDFFFSASLAVGIFSSYTQELYRRRNFIYTHLLLLEKVRSEKLGREAQAASLAKSEFLASMSHELRTPLNAVIGFTEVMKLQIFGPIGSERYMGYVDDIHNSGTHLLSIINDILDLAKAEANKLTLAEEQLDLCDLIDGSIRMFRNTAATQGVRLAFSLPREQPILRGDLRLLRQVLINLISNAIKFTLTGGAVTISVHTDSDGCRVAVEDTGIGIAHENLEKILEPFVQVESADSRKHGGTGLGLPLVKRIVELHGGTLLLESDLGIGTRITVWLPADRVVDLKQPEEEAERLPVLAQTG
jgi:two-component system cell cycle sensor histidine kinase PleC